MRSVLYRGREWDYGLDWFNTVIIVLYSKRIQGISWGEMIWTFEKKLDSLRFDRRDFGAIL